MFVKIHPLMSLEGLAYFILPASNLGLASPLIKGDYIEKQMHFWAKKQYITTKLHMLYWETLFFWNSKYVTYANEFTLHMLVSIFHCLLHTHKNLCKPMSTFPEISYLNQMTPPIEICKEVFLLVTRKCG